jgi:hypothetical protein
LVIKALDPYWSPTSYSGSGSGSGKNEYGSTTLDESFCVFEECESSCSQMKQELTNCYYLEDQSITLFGLKIYGKTTELF